MPGNIACYTGLLAKTYGWTVEYILWDLPYSIGRQLQHFAFRSEGTVTVKREEMGPPVSNEDFDAVLWAGMPPEPPPAEQPPPDGI